MPAATGVPHAIAPSLLHDVFRWAGAFALAMGLSACGGGGGDEGGGPPAAPPVRTSGPAEFGQCDVPRQVVIARELDAGQWRTNRYVAMPGEALARMVPAAGLATGKNPEGVLNHGPLQAQNCTPGTGAAQTMRFLLRTDNFFSSGIADHLSFGVRASFPTLNREGEEAYDAIGMVLHPAWGGALAERFRRPGGNDIGSAAGDQVPVLDGQDYRIEMQATQSQVLFRATVIATGQTTGWKSYTQPAGYAPLTGTGFMIAVLCQDDNARCEGYDRPFRIDVRELELGWQ